MNLVLFYLRSRCWGVSLLKAFEYRFPLAWINTYKYELTLLLFINRVSNFASECRVFNIIIECFEIPTTASVINFKPKNHSIVFLAGLFHMVSLLLPLHLMCTSWFLLIERKLLSINGRIWGLTPSSEDDMTRCKPFRTVQLQVTLYLLRNVIVL